MKNIIHLVVAVVMSTMVYGQESIERVPPAQTDYETVYGPFEDEICELCLEDGDYNIIDFLSKDSNNISWGMSYSVGSNVEHTKDIQNNEYHTTSITSLTIFIGITKYIYPFYSMNIINYNSQDVFNINTAELERNYSIYGVRVSPYQNDKIQTYIGYGVGTAGAYMNVSEFQIGALYNLHKFRDKINLGVSVSGNFGTLVEKENNSKQSNNNISLGVFFKF